MAETGFLGMFGTGHWTNEERPKNYREMILYLFPNGSAPLTAIMSKLRSEATNDPEFKWYEKPFPEQSGAVTNVYVDPGLSTAYAYATHGPNGSGTKYGVKGGVVYAKCAADVASNFRKGHLAVIVTEADPDSAVAGSVVAVNSNGASSYVAVRLREDDDNGTDTDGDSVPNYTLATADHIFVAGNTNPEGGVMPDSVSYKPILRNNYCFISKTPLSITRTAQKTRLRTADAVKEAKREALMIHSIENERQLIWGIPFEDVGDNNQLERGTGGILYWIRQDQNATKANYALDTSADFAGKKWVVGGEAWMDEKLEQIFRWNESKVLMGLCGSGALLGLQKLAKASGQITMPVRTAAYGIRVTTWSTVFGDIELITHPLFSFSNVNRNRIIIGDPRKLVWRFIDDTFYESDPGQGTGGAGKIDGISEQYVTEGGLELHHARAWGDLSGIGLDNTQ